MLGQAWRHHGAGRLREAADIYKRVLELEPDQPAALNLLGAVAHQNGESRRAIELISRALAVKPDFAEAHSNLGLALRQIGRLDDAIASYRRAIALKPGLAGPHNNMGLALHDLGRLDDAGASYRKALALKPEYPEAHKNLGDALRGLGQPKDAAASYRKAISMNADFAQAHNGLGGALHEVGRLDQAVESYRTALALKPDMAAAQANLGLTLRKLGRLDEAFECQRRAIALEPDAGVFWLGFADALEPLTFTFADEDLYQDLVRLLERPSVRPDLVTRPVLSALCCHEVFSRVFDASLEGQDELVYAAPAGQLAAIPLLLRIMSLTPIADPQVEEMFTRLRRAMAEEALAGNIGDECLPFSVALALHCFVNGYVFWETPDETAAAEKLEEDLAARVRKGHDVPPARLIALAAYRPLHRFPWAEQLLDRAWPGGVEDVIKRQIREPAEERSLRRQVRSLTPIRDAVSAAVRAQYEESPYPVWVKTSAGAKPQTIGQVLQGSPTQLDLGDYVSPESPEILIAGCGTGQHALQTASRFSNARVLALDLSSSSLGYAVRKTRELGVSNIEYAQADIMELGGLGREFDLIESSGVLHHLGDPLAGWRILVGLLRSGGLMKIGLYSELARRPLEKARSVIAAKGYTASPGGIRKCRQDLIAMTGDAEISKVVRLKDFFSLGECRDLLFHVQEQCFTLPQIETALTSLGLTFLGFEMRNQAALRRFAESHPGKGALASLSLWHEFECENPETFAGMYQFWCRKM